MSQSSGYLGKPFWIWVLANVLGFAALGALLFAFPALMSIRGIVVSTLLIAIPIGLAQWIALRRILSTSILWVLTVPVGVLCALSLARVIPEGFWRIVDDESIAVLTASYLVIGFAVGVPQWLILRRQLAGSWIWLLGSSIGPAAGLWFGLTTDLIHRAELIAYVVVIGLYAIATGLALSRLLVSHSLSQTRPANAT